MKEQDEPSKSALDKDDPPQQEDDGDKGLGTKTGAEGGPGEEGQDITKLMPHARGKVRYPPHEDPNEARDSIAPQEGHVEKDPDTSHDSSSGAKD